MWDCLAEWLLDPSGTVDAVRDSRHRRRMRQRVRAGKILCAVRIVDGAQPGLSRRWRRGAARVPAGTLVFEPDSRRRRATIGVRSATLQPPGDVPRWTSRGLGAHPRLITLETDQATLEWLLPEDRVERAMRVTSPSVRLARPPAV